jgi:cytochrome c556
MRRRQLTLMALLIGMLGLVLMLTGAQAQDDEHYLGYRQKVMESMGASMGAIGDILKHKLPFAGHIGVHASDISRMSAAIALAFEREITEGRTDAKPEVWQDWDKFVTAAETLQEEGAKLADIASTGDMAAIGAQVKNLGKACGDCHKPFRKPKEERFKRGTAHNEHDESH